MKRKILITGASGKLGKVLLKNPLLQNYQLFTPSHAELDITNKKAVTTYFAKQTFDIIIHLAALANVKLSEEKPLEAIKTTYLGTANVLESLSHKEKIHFIFLSTDYVYPCVKGPYKETDELVPFTIYGWTKLAAEQLVKKLPSYCIMRTSFFDPDKVNYETAPSDAFVSKISFQEGAAAIMKLVELHFQGTINVGQERISLFDLYKKYNRGIKANSIKDIPKEQQRAPDSSLDVSLWKRIIKGK